MSRTVHKVGIIGCGYWGANLVRNFRESHRAQLVQIADLDQTRLDRFRHLYSDLSTTRDWQAVVNNPAIDVVAIATPTAGHFEPAEAALAAGKHVMITKPMAASSQQCEALMATAAKHDRLILLDHTFIYTDAVRHIHSLIKNGTLGNILYYDSTRINLGLFQTDVSVVWDLAVHDLAIIDYLLPEKPVAVSCIAAGHVTGSPENIAFITLFFPSGAIAHINVNWMSPVKVRQVLIGGDQRMVIYNDIEASEKIRLYDRGVSLVRDKDEMHKFMATYRMGGVEIPALPGKEALKTELDHLFDCIEQRQTPITDAASGLRIVRLLEALNRSIAERGKTIDLPPMTSAAALHQPSAAAGGDVRLVPYTLRQL